MIWGVMLCILRLCLFFGPHTLEFVGVIVCIIIVMTELEMTSYAQQNGKRARYIEPYKCA